MVGNAIVSWGKAARRAWRPSNARQRDDVDPPETLIFPVDDWNCSGGL